MEQSLKWIVHILLVYMYMVLTHIAGYPNLATQEANESSIQIKNGPGAGALLLANMAVDGDRNTDGDTYPYCAQTNFERNSWWKVQLDTSSHIDQIKIWLRGDYWGSNQPRNYDIYITDSGTCNTGTVCVRQAEVNNMMTAVCTGGVGQWVVICGSQTYRMAVMLCEVEIYGCPKGKYGDNCQLQCNKCLHSFCYLADGRCLDGCVANYWGAKCDNVCSNNCDDSGCEHLSGFCNTCRVGYWGNTCNANCSDTCRDQGCRQNDGKCIGCESGYWGDTCTEKCSGGCDEQGCIQSSGSCIACHDGTWGDTCTNDCPKECNRSRCTQNDGSCLGCNDGQWNVICNKQCGECSNVSCSQTDGRCESACKLGYLPPKCFCSTHCSYGICNENTRVCTYSCKENYFGSKCTEQCNSNCLNGACDPNTGYCSGGCTDGYWDKECSKACTNCKDSSCAQNNGICSYGCFNSSFWGSHCKPCPDNCKGGICKSDNGDCVDGCAAGHWTVRCNDSCSSNCMEKACNQEDAVCTLGCITGHTGATCMQKSSSPNDDMTAAISAGVVVPLLLIACASIAAVFFIRRRRAKKDTADEDFDDTQSSRKHHEERTPAIDLKNETEAEDAGNVYGNVGSENSQHGISVNNLGDQIRQKQENNSFDEEYKKFPTGLNHPHEVGKAKVNIPKNRFRSTFPYDHSRVLLHALPGEPHSDYINCSYIENLEGKKIYIAAQGPKSTTITDFWRMIWQLECETIVMLTNLKEGPKVKCECYWPESGEKLDAGLFKLNLNYEEVRSVYTIRKIAVSKEASKSRMVTQFHFTAWPDHGVADPLQLTKFHRCVKQYTTSNSGPLVVHCSAGIGRTGTYIALDALFDFGKKHGQVDIPGYVAKMRYNRMNMIQTIDQYKLLYEALYEEFMYPSSAIPRTSYLDEYPKLSNGKPANQTRINKEFGNLMTMKKEFANSEYKAAFLEENLSKNRGGTTIALEKYRPFLSTHVSGLTDYINAVAIPGSKEGSRYHYLLTQIPLTNTVFDFWRMLYDQESNVVVKLNDIPSGQPPVIIFPSSGESFTIGALTVDMETDVSKSDDVVEHTFTITHKINSDTKKVKVLDFQKWQASKELPPSSQQMLKLIDKVSRWQDQNGLHPVTVMCLNGSKCSGLYCAVSKLMEQLRMEQEVDVYQAVREIQYRCPQCIDNVAQYRFCYQTVREHLSVDDVYANT